MLIRSVCVGALLCVSSATHPGVLAADDYPAHPIKIIVPVPPGGTADAVPRLMAERLAGRFHWSVIVDNRPGAALNIGAASVAHALPDGYTLLATPPGPLITSQFLYQGLTFDPTALVPVTILGEVPFALVVRPDFPAPDLSRLVAYAKDRPGNVTFGSPGAGSPPHVTAALFASETGVKLLHVPYKGMTAALNDLLGGHIDVMFHDVASVLPLLQAGRIKALGVSSAARLPELPDVPSICELAPDFIVTTWYAVMAPPQTPTVVVSKLAAAISEVLQAPDVAQRLAKLGMTPVGSAPLATKEFIDTERKRWHSILVAAKLVPP